jgi:ribosome-binding protein aMBF1 (putative translation factor)
MDQLSIAKSLSDLLAERGLTLAQLIETSKLDERVVKAIAAGRYTPSPEQRRRLAGVLGVEADQIAWGHVNQVSHVYGHGPQFGRSP